MLPVSDAFMPAIDSEQLTRTTDYFDVLYYFQVSLRAEELVASNPFELNNARFCLFYVKLNPCASDGKIES